MPQKYSLTYNDLSKDRKLEVYLTYFLCWDQKVKRTAIVEKSHLNPMRYETTKAAQVDSKKPLRTLLITPEGSYRISVTKICFVNF